MNDDSSEALSHSTAVQLLKFLHLDDASTGAWTEQDIPAMLRHQLNAPLEFGARAPALSQATARARGKLSNPVAAPLGTFQDLLDHPQPPISLLRTAKDFFKARTGNSSKRRPEEDIAYLMYLAVIVIARVRLEQPITRLAESDLLAGIGWVLDQIWVDPRTKAFFAECAQRLDAGRAG